MNSVFEMITGGVGGGKTITGLKFEKRTELKKVIASVPGYTIISDKVYFNGEEVAQIYRKNKLYKNLLEPNKINYKTIISKKLIPDDAIFVLKKNVLYIVETKFQGVSGSVDEKLQTCVFKNKQYHKLLAQLKIDVNYVYVLNDWFKKDEYKDVLEYVVSVGCYYFFNEIPLEFLGLPTNA